MHAHVCMYTQVCTHTQPHAHTSKWGRSEMLWSVGVIQRKQQRQDRLELGCSTTPSYTGGGTRARRRTVCAYTHAQWDILCKKWQSWDVRRTGKKRGGGVVERTELFFFLFSLSLAWLSSEKVHVLKMFSSEQQAYLSVVVGVCLPWQDEFAAKSGFKFTACRALTRHP